MTQREMIFTFNKLGISQSMFWLGAVEKADSVNGLTYDGRNWIVYYRAQGLLSNVAQYDTHEAACDELFKRVMELMEA